MADHNASSSPWAQCFTVEPFIYIFFSFNIANILQFPLFAFILYLFYLQWRVQRSTSRMPHSDYLTLHMTVINMFSILGSILCLVDYNGHTRTTETGLFIMILAWYVGIFLHFLTCLDQYLAVVHPVTYIRLKQSTGMRMRHLSIFLVWVISIVPMVFDFIEESWFILELIVLTSVWTPIIACSLVVLWILTQPKPGKKNERVLSQQNRKAFYIILLILGVLSSKFIWGLTLTKLYMSEKLNRMLWCFMETIEWWFNIPSNLILPVMFLAKAPKA